MNRNPRQRNRLASPLASAPARRPSIPLGKTGNAALDAFMEVVRERLEVLDGGRGNPQERVVTERRLHELGLTGGSQPVALNENGGLVFKQPNGSYGSLSAEQFAGLIRDTRLYKDLTSRVQSLERFDKYGGKLETLVSETNGALARLDELRIAYTSESEAVAGIVTQVRARMDDFGGDGVTIEQLIMAEVDRVDGLYGQYYLKLDVNGKVSGFGLASDEATSAFIIVADKFAIVDSEDTILDPENPPLNRIPFGVDADNDTIYLNGQVRIDTGGPRILDITRNLALSSSAYSIHVSAGGTATPSSVTLTATLNNGLTGTPTFTVTNGTATLTGTGLTRTLTNANMTTNSVTIKASLTVDGVTFEDSVTISRATDGDDGVAGSRGSLTGYGQNYGINSTSWSDGIANRVVHNMLNGASLTTSLGSTSHLALGDTVTLSNNSTFAQTKYWGGSAWLDPGVVIDGNLLVTGTVSADALTVGSASDARGQVDLLGFNNVLRVARNGATTTPAMYVADNISGGGTSAFWVYQTASSGPTNAVELWSEGSSTITLDVISKGSSSGAAKFKNYAGSPSTTSKEFWAAPGAYSAYAPAGKGKYYFPDGSGPFTGFHSALAPIAEYTLGDIVVDVEVVDKPDVNNALSIVAVSNAPNQKGALGVVSQIRPLLGGFEEELRYDLWCEYFETHHLLDVNGVGEGCINVCGEGGAIEKGDLIVCSSVPGKGMRQADDLVRAYTVARARETVTFDTPEQVKQIACIYLCG